MRWAPQAGGGPRVGYAIGRRVGNAVVRNRVRRRLRAIVTDQAQDMPAGFYLLAVAPEAAVRSYDELAGEVARARQAVTGR